MNFSLHQTQRLIQLLKCPVHSKTVTVIEAHSETGPSLKVSAICCEQFRQTITVLVKTNLQQDLIEQEKINVKDISTRGFEDNLLLFPS